MTDFDLLEIIGEVDERYIDEARRAAVARKNPAPQQEEPAAAAAAPMPVPVQIPEELPAEVTKPVAEMPAPEEVTEPVAETPAEEEPAAIILPMPENLFAAEQQSTPVYAYDEAEDAYDEEDEEDEEPVRRAPKQEKRRKQSRNTGKSGKSFKPLLIAACLMLVIACAGGGAVFYSLSRGGDAAVAAEAAAVKAATADEAAATMIMQADPSEPDVDDWAEELPEAAEEANSGAGAAAVTLKAPAEIPEPPESWDYAHQTSDEAIANIDKFAFKTAAAVFGGVNQSVCYSPLSLYNTLSILASGAEGDTRTQLLDLLNADDADTLAEAMSTCIRWNTRADDAYTMRIANSVWADETLENGVPIVYNENWMNTAAGSFYSDVYSAEFSDPAIGEALGSWVAEKTNGFLAPSGTELQPDDSTAMVVLNSVLYQAQWQTAFDPADNTEDTFTTADGQEVTATFMHQTDRSSRAVLVNGYTKSRIFLNSGRIIIVLPDEGVDIEDLLNAEDLSEMFNNSDYDEVSVNWSIPKFDTTTTISDLPMLLQSLGVTDAFSPETANFAGISDTALHVGKLQQGSRISVNEDGIQAAAYTEAGMELASEPPSGLRTIDMNLNRPFLYLITADDGTTLFMGIVRNLGE